MYTKLTSVVLFYNLFPNVEKQMDTALEPLRNPICAISLGRMRQTFFLQTFQLSDSFARALKNRFESFSLFLTELKVISLRILN